MFIKWNKISRWILSRTFTTKDTTLRKIYFPSSPPQIFPNIQYRKFPITFHLRKIHRHPRRSIPQEEKNHVCQLFPAPLVLVTGVRGCQGDVRVRVSRMCAFSYVTSEDGVGAAMRLCGGRFHGDQLGTGVAALPLICSRPCINTSYCYIQLYSIYVVSSPLPLQPYEEQICCLFDIVGRRHWIRWVIEILRRTNILHYSVSQFR